MFKKIILLFFLIFSIQSAFAELKIGFVKVDEILKNAPQAEKSNKKLEKEFKARTEKLKKNIGNLNDSENKFRKDSLTLSDKEKEIQLKDLQQSRIDIQRTERELREDIDIRRREEIEKLQAQVTKVIEKLSEDQKFDLILYTGVAYASDKVDITPMVLKALSDIK